MVSVGNSVEHSVEHSVGASVGVSVEHSVLDNVSASVKSGVWDSMFDSVRDSVRDSVGASVVDNVSTSAMDSVGIVVGGRVVCIVVVSVRNSVWASVWAYAGEPWLAFYQFFHEVFEENKLIHLARFNAMVSGYRLGSKEAWLVRKPVRLERDEQGRLHSADGMCMHYRDGWGFYAWHGVHVPERVILDPDRLTREDFLTESNVEVRRVMQERMGSRFVSELGGVVLDRGPRGTLYEVALPDDPERVARYVQVQDASTPRQYMLRVPPTIQTAAEAVAWSFQIGVEDYHPTQET